MEQFDYKLIEAARDLGASDIRIFFDIIVPQTIAGVVAGAIIVYARMAGAYITPTVLGGTDNVMIASTIVDAFRVYLDWEFAAAISMLFLVTVIVLFSVSAISKDIRQEFKQW
jgi:spermidine/putrescine transport system permease protein